MEEVRCQLLGVLSNIGLPPPHAPQHLEIELRLRTPLPKIRGDKLLAALRSSSIAHTEKLQETVDSIVQPPKGHSNKRVTTYLAPEGSVPTVTTKKKLVNHDLDANARVSCNLEETKPAQPASKKLPVLLRRIKRRVTFFDGGFWNIDITFVSSTAPDDMDAEEEVVEVEVELADTDCLLYEPMDHMLNCGLTRLSEMTELSV